MAQALDMKETAGFKAAVAEEVAKQTADLAAQMAELKALMQNSAASPVPVGSDAKALMEHLALALGDISAQGVGVQKPVPPEVLRVREEARLLMIERIKEARAKGEIPHYKVLAVIQADFGRAGQALVHPFWEDRDKVKQATTIDWPGIPNSSLEPLNDVAKEIMALYRDSVGNMGRVSAAEQLKGLSPAFVHGAQGLTKKRDAPGQFDVAHEEGAVRVHNRSRNSTRRVNILGNVAEPAEISG